MLLDFVVKVTSLQKVMRVRLCLDRHRKIIERLLNLAQFGKHPATSAIGFLLIRVFESDGLIAVGEGICGSADASQGVTSFDIDFSMIRFLLNDQVEACNGSDIVTVVIGLDTRSVFRAFQKPSYSGYQSRSSLCFGWACSAPGDYGCSFWIR